MRALVFVVLVACTPRTEPFTVPIAGSAEMKRPPLTVPNRPEDWDSDRDGTRDSEDLCPGDPEDKDGFEDIDGCPDPDNDRDGIPDVSDKCPNDPETYNGLDDDDGCPDKNKVIIMH
jgi:hypothetical protein